MIAGIIIALCVVGFFSIGSITSTSQTMTGKLVNVYHVESAFVDGSERLVFSNGQTLQYERGYSNFLWVINATYQINYSTNFFDSTILDSVVLVSNS